MKTPILVTALLALVATSAISQDNRVLGIKIAEAAALLEQTREHGKELRDLIRISEAGKHLSPEQNKRFLYLQKEASIAHSRAKEIVGMLELGNSVFQYPGLLSMGKIHYQPRKEKYTLSIATATDKWVDIEFHSTGSVSKLVWNAPIR